MSIQTIYIRLVQEGMSPVGACAMLGNMQDESGLISTNVQNGMGYADADYTAAVDAGAIDFISDQRGYGLCQWTLPARKRKMLQFHRERGVSIGDEPTQVDFALHELQNEPEYRALWNYLRSATGIYEAAERICKEYERPAEQVVNVKERAAYANQFYMQLGGLEVGSANSGTAPDNSPTGEPGDAIFHTPAGGSASSTAYPQGTQSGPPSPQGEGYWPPRVLTYGMFGPDVVALQGLLIAHGYPAGITGTFDQATHEKLREFQQARGLTADSIAGRQTWAALVKGV